VDINGVMIRGSFVHIDEPRLLEIDWGEAGNAQMPPGATRLVVRFEAIEGGTRVALGQDGLALGEAGKHAVGWPHFLERLRVVGGGGDAGQDPWVDPRR
jgi:uncharacterized protein YndB with AHSA1/START domain